MMRRMMSVVDAVLVLRTRVALKPGAAIAVPGVALLRGAAMVPGAAIAVPGVALLPGAALVLGAALALGLAAGANTLEMRGGVESVTVYRGQALVTRALDVAGPAGLRELVVTELPEAVVPDSLYAETSGAAEVRSVRYRIRPQAEDVREEVRKFDEQIQAAQDQIQTIARRRQTLGEYKAYLDKLEQFIAPTATVEMTRGVLNAETIKMLTMFLLEQRTKLADDELKFTVEERGINVKLNLLQRERNTLAGGTARNAREAVIFLNVTDAAGGKLRLRYLVNNATWTPSYSVRTDEKRDKVRIDYYASIQQMSGEDWGDVAMTLSTATPNLVAKAPALAPLTVALSSLQQPAQTAGKGAMNRDELANKQKELEIARNIAQPQKAQSGQTLQLDMMGEVAGSGRGGGGPGGIAYGQNALDLDKELNDVACSVQLIDLTSRGRISRSEKDAARPVEELCVTYELPTRTTLPSRSDQQLVQIATLGLPGEFYRVASPVLTSFVYEEASVTNDSTLVLLAGPVASYVDGQFVGHGEIRTVTAGEKFSVGLGIDSSLRASRELVDREERIQGGNRVVEFTYRLALENFAGKPASVRLMDRVPTGRDAEVKVTLASAEDDLSGDARYRKTDRKKGLLRWDVQAPAQATGMSAKAIEYKFKVEYDKGMTITGVPVAMQ